MFRLKLLAGLAATALSLAVVTALASGTTKLEAAAIPASGKGDRLDIRPSDACRQDQWPFGCQWQMAAPTRIRPHIATRTDTGQRSRPREPLSVWKRRLAGYDKRAS